MEGFMASKQRATSRLIAQAGQMLLAHGAESALVGDIMRRIGLASGMDEVEVALSANSLVVTTMMDDHCITTTRSCPDRGINMRAVTQIQRICIMLEKGIVDYLVHLEQTELGQGFWDFGIVSDLETSSVNNNAYNIYLSAQCNGNSTSFLAKDMKISSLIEQRGDVHHLFPKKYLSQNGYAPKLYNQVANFVYTEQVTNIKVGMLSPQEYMDKVKAQIANNEHDISTIDSEALLTENLTINDIPVSLLTADHANYEDFLKERRQLMGQKIKIYYEQL